MKKVKNTNLRIIYFIILLFFSSAQARSISNDVESFNSRIIQGNKNFQKIQSCGSMQKYEIEKRGYTVIGTQKGEMLTSSNTNNQAMEIMILAKENKQLIYLAVLPKSHTQSNIIVPLSRMLDFGFFKQISGNIINNANLTSDNQCGVTVLNEIGIVVCKYNGVFSNDNDFIFLAKDVLQNLYFISPSLVSYSIKKCREK